MQNSPIETNSDEESESVVSNQSHDVLFIGDQGTLPVETRRGAHDERLGLAAVEAHRERVFVPEGARLGAAFGRRVLARPVARDLRRAGPRPRRVVEVARGQVVLDPQGLNDVRYFVASCHHFNSVQSAE